MRIILEKHTCNKKYIHTLWVECLIVEIKCGLKFNLIKGFWGEFDPRGSRHVNIFIGSTYSFIPLKGLFTFGSLLKCSLLKDLQGSIMTPGPMLGSELTPETYLDSQRHVG